MPKLEITKEEQQTIALAIETEIKSAKRAQNNSKTPQIKEVHQALETNLTALRAKILEAK